MSNNKNEDNRKMKTGTQHGFTLSEALITLGIIGVLAVLVLPGLIKDTINKSNMTLLQGTVTTLSEAVQNELLNNATTKIKSTDIYKNPTAFLKRTLDVREVCDSSSSDCIYYNVQTLSDGWYNIGENREETVILANGVSLGMMPHYSLFDDKEMPVIVDLNGTKDPNIVGLDVFMICIGLVDDAVDGVHPGDVGACHTGSRYSGDPAEVDSFSKFRCEHGQPDACYLRAETYGFSTKYLEINGGE